MGTSAYSVGTGAVLASQPSELPRSSPDPDVPYSLTHSLSIRWPVHTPSPEQEQDNRNVHQSGSHGFDLLSLSSRYASESCISFPTHLTLISHSCLLPRHLEEVSLSYPLHYLLCRKALWHRSAHPVIFIFSDLLLTLSKASSSPQRSSTSYKMPLIVSRILKSNNIPTLVAGLASSCKYSLLSGPQIY